MLQRKPGHHPLATILVALFVLYVASYIAIRFTSAWVPGTRFSSGGRRGLIVLGMTQSELMAGLSSSAPATPTSAARRHHFLQAVYLPLRWVDRRITRTAI